ncbi:MAG: right-handed parallel beta-helix repeat-containing protein [Microbacteriaceae bacterium]|nr:right-handed parallel beta-helix repeat-containing protein [Microbacteriaceae bacterium]
MTASPTPTPSVRASAPATTSPEGLKYPGDGHSEALLVATEQRRLISVRSVAKAAEWTGVSHHVPYRMATGNFYTLVLVPRAAEYTVGDLTLLSPRTFVRQPDGSYILSESIIIERGATLSLRSGVGLVIRLLSEPRAFVSIITIGGSLTIEGTKERPVEVSSWDRGTGAPDVKTADGRAYVRIIGGHAALSNVKFHDLGFWSGVTGGVSLTGTVLPGETKSTVTTGKDGKVVVGAIAATPAALAPGAVTDNDPATINPKIYGSEIYPAGDGAGSLSLEPDLNGFSYVSALISNVIFDKNAYGLFITNANGVEVRNSIVSNSLVNGMTFHRNVTNSKVSDSSAIKNGVDGFSLARATSGVVFDQLTATGNGRNGIAVDGRPLATGPSAVGTSIDVFGNNRISNSRSSSNGRYGIMINNGINVTISGNTIANNRGGIVVTGGTRTVAVVGNTVTGSVTQGIALRDGVTDATVTSNIVDGGQIGIYLRGTSRSDVERNKIEHVTNHAITLIGDAKGSRVSNNTISGSGPSGLDVKRAPGVYVSLNDLTRWESTKSFFVILGTIFQPLTIMWTLLGLLVLISAISSVRRRNIGIVDPYSELAPLSSLSKGVVTVSDLLRAESDARQAQHA